MKWTASISQPKPLDFVVEQTEFDNLSTNTKSMGFYVYVYENGECIYDYLQDTLEIAKSFSLKKFGVPLDAWKRVD